MTPLHYAATVDCADPTVAELRSAMDYGALSDDGNEASSAMITLI